MKIFLLCLLLAFSLPSEARSRAVRAHYQRLHPCPANGKVVGACPGYVVDHVIALCVGGVDAVENMQWMTAEAAKVKDRTECKRPVPCANLTASAPQR